MGANPSSMKHPWSIECSESDNKVKTCLVQNQTKSESESCNPCSKGFIDIESEEYEVKETVLRALVAIMVFGGILTVLSNMAVIFFGLRRKRLFPAPILSLAFTDLLTGILATPLVIVIYYTSECQVKKAGPHNFLYQQESQFSADQSCGYMKLNFIKTEQRTHLYLTIHRAHTA